jgi:pyruvate formate lyase activating enzyme
MANSRPTLPRELQRAAEIGRQAGLHYVYVERAEGNARDTFCPACRALLVARDIWSLRTNVIRNGKCPACVFPIEGRWY